MNLRKHRDLDRARITRLPPPIRSAAAPINGLKLRIEDMIERGPCDLTVRARYGKRASMLAGSTLDQAIAKTAAWLQDARKPSEPIFPYPTPQNAPAAPLAELRLILRLMRRDRHRTGFDQFPGILGFVLAQNVASNCDLHHISGGRTVHFGRIDVTGRNENDKRGVDTGAH